jgi:dTMP kinase
MATAFTKAFIVLEGVDFSGKTTVANLLSQLLGARVLKSPPPPFESIKQSVLEDAEPLARFCYFLASNVQISKMASAIIATESVVCDRYVWSTIAYYSAIENVSPQRIVDLANPILKSLLLPNMVVFLRVDRQSQLLRARNKVDNRLQHDLLLSDKFQQKLGQAYEKTRNLIKVQWLEVDTSNLSVSESVQEIVAEMGEKLSRTCSK